MKKLLVGICALIFGTMLCHAADVGGGYIVPKAQAQTAQTVNWSGGYLGGLIGYGWKDQDNTIVGNNALSSTLISAGIVPSSANLRPSGAMLGGVIGYDYQFAPRFIGGIAVDYSWANLRDSTTAIGNLVNRSVDEKISSFGSVRGRLGYLITDRAMIYATGGWAWANVRVTDLSAGPICGGFIVCASGASSNTKSGWVIGGGAEYRLDRNWSLSAEALWADLGTQTTTLTGRIGPLPLSYTQSQDAKIGVVRAGLNYRF